MTKTHATLGCPKRVNPPVKDPESAGSKPLAGVFRNAIFLALVNFSNYVVPFMYVPFLLRTIGAERYGAVVFTQAVAQYLSVLVDFGFSYSATRRIALVRYDHEQLRREFSANMMAKCVLAAVAGCLVVVMLALSPRMRAEWPLFLLWAAGVLNNVLLPNWFFQGMEAMRTLSLINIFGRVASLFGLLLLVKSPADDWVAVAILAGCPALAGALGLGVALSRYRMTLFAANGMSIARAIRSSAALFVTTLSANLYTTTVTVILGLVAPNSIVSAYAIADKCARVCTLLIAPLSSSVYPRISKLAAMCSREVAVKAALQSGAFIIATGLAASVALLMGGHPIVRFFVGHDDEAVLQLLRISAWLPAVISIGNVFGVQILMAFGVTRSLVKWQLVVALIGMPMTYALARGAGGRGAASSALLLEVLIAVGFTFLAYRQVLSSASTSFPYLGIAGAKHP